MDDELDRDVPVLDNALVLADGDDSLLAAVNGAASGLSGAPRSRSASRARRMIVGKLGRTLRRGMHGSDVKAVKRALYRAKVTRTPLRRHTNKFTRATEKNIKRFQKRHGLPQTGVYGPKTHRYLKRHFDGYAVYLYHHGKAKPKKADARTRVRALALGGVSKNHLTSYTQGFLRWMGIRNRIRWPRVPSWADCSSWYTYIYWHEGLPDPNNQAYMAGFTGTLATHGRSVSIVQARPGDAILYGHGWPFSHVAVYVGGGVAAGHGSSAGPRLTRWNYRSDVAQIRSYLP